MPLERFIDFAVDFKEFLVYGKKVDFFFGDGGADVAGDVEVVSVLFDFFHRYAAGITFFFCPVHVGVEDFVDVFFGQFILLFPFFEVVGGVDE